MQLGDRTSLVTVCIIPNMDGVLLSWHDSIALGLLPDNFPCQIIEVGPKSGKDALSPLGSRYDAIIALIT